MRSILLALSVVMIGGGSAIAEDAVLGDQGVRPLLTFVSDVTTFEGMYYSVHDYCSQYTTKSVADLSKNSWLNTNSSLLSARDDAVNRLMTTVSQRENGKDASEKIYEWVKTIIVKARANDRLYKDIVPLQDKLVACNKRLGEMNSQSMRFESISPASYSFWLQHRSP